MGKANMLCRIGRATVDDCFPRQLEMDFGKEHQHQVQVRTRKHPNLGTMETVNITKHLINDTITYILEFNSFKHLILLFFPIFLLCPAIV